MYNYIIDFSKVKVLWDIHEQIQIGLKLPAWYGKNLDAFWDSITGIIDIPCTITVLGKNDVPMTYKKEIEEIMALLYEAQSDYYDIRIKEVEN